MKTDLEKVIAVIVNHYYDLDLTEEDCIKLFLDDLYYHYEYDILQKFLDEKDDAHGVLL